MRIPRTFLLVSVVLLFASLVYGQGVATGDLHVTVKDPQGNLVTNATVVVRDEAKGIERPAASNGSGEYSAQALPPTSYTVTVTASGFASATAPAVVITVGSVEELPITLGVAGGKESITVNAAAELIETSRTGVVDTVNQRSIENLPINGRKYTDFTLTDSQVVRDNAPNTGAAPTSGLNMSGQRARSNLVNVDGADATDNSVNGVRSTVSQEAVQEFQIITNSYAPEYGRASGGVVNIVTKSGVNDFHGDIFGFLRNRNIQAVNPFAVCASPPCSKPAYTRVQGGAAFGGALKKDKTFYFFSYEITRRHETGFSSIGTNGFDLQSFDATGIFNPLAPAGCVPRSIRPGRPSSGGSSVLYLDGGGVVVAGGKREPAILCSASVRRRRGSQSVPDQLQHRIWPALRGSTGVVSEPRIPGRQLSSIRRNQPLLPAD